MPSKDIKYQYTLGSEINLKEEASFRDFINTQGIYADEFELSRYIDVGSLELRYEDGYLSHIRKADELNDGPVPLQEASRSFRYFEYQKHRINYLVPQEELSHSYLGGLPEGGFTLPATDWIGVPFQMIGKFSRRDTPFRWLPFEELFLAYPLFAGITEFLFLDYTNPLRPTVFAEPKEVQYPFNKMPAGGIHQFQRTYLEMRSIHAVEDKDDLSFEYWYAGITGVPFWVQHPEIPRCPKTGRLMRFVGQVDTTESIKIEQSSLSSDTPYFSSYSEDLRFWGSGSLYIFLEPESRIVGVVVQDT